MPTSVRGLYRSLPLGWDIPEVPSPHGRRLHFTGGYDFWRALQHENLTLNRAEACPCRGHGLGKRDSLPGPLSPREEPSLVAEAGEGSHAGPGNFAATHSLLGLPRGAVKPRHLLGVHCGRSDALACSSGTRGLRRQKAETQLVPDRAFRAP